MQNCKNCENVITLIKCSVLKGEYISSSKGKKPQGEDVSVLETLSEPSLELSELSVAYMEKLEYLFGE